MNSNRTRSNTVYEAPIATSSRDRAFTLIELLVIVAIIALLIAILLPSLTAARDQAKAAVCATRIRECTRGLSMWMLEEQNERVPTNFGWATGALFEASGQTEFFRCPTDATPSPMPAFRIRMYTNGFGTLRSIGSPDGPFNKTNPDGTDAYLLNVQDSVEGKNFGGDTAWNPNDYDLMFRYMVPPGAAASSVTLLAKESDVDFAISDVRGRVIFADAKEAINKEFAAPLLWGSYAMNVSAGIRNQKTNNIVLLAEYGKWAAVPERLGSFDRDLKFAEWVKLRHASPRKDAKGIYTSGKANVSFLDGHVERLDRKKLLYRDSLLWHPVRPLNWSPTF